MGRLGVSILDLTYACSYRSLTLNNHMIPFRIVFGLILAMALAIPPAAAPIHAQAGDEGILPPLSQNLAWQDAGIVQKEFFADGQLLIATGGMFKSQKNPHVDDIFEYYSSEHLETLGWSFVGGMGVELTYQHTSGQYLTVEIAPCAQTEYCVTVWMSLEITEEISDEPADLGEEGLAATANAFSKTVPANGATIAVPANSYKYLQWGDAQKNAADRYLYCIDDINNSLCDNQWIERNSLYSGDNEFKLQPNKTYYWQVRLRDANITANNGVWWSFKTANTQSSFTKTSPANGVTIPMPATTYQLLRWSSASKAVSDRYQYCIDKTDNSHCDTEWVTRNSLYSGGPGDFALQYGTTYYWQVRLRDAATTANNGVWWSFKIQGSETLTAVPKAGQDGWVLESTETSNTGGTLNKNGSLLRIGDGTSNRQYRSILSFDTAPLPDNAVITAATLRLKYAGKTGALPFGTHGKMLVDIRKGAFGGNSALGLGDFNAKASKNSVLTFSQVPANQWFSKALAEGNLAYINKTGPTQFRLRFQLDDNNNLLADFIKIYSGNAHAANRPQLIVEYFIP
jgi:hypothetical protein